jgi:hypothetical protein
MRGSPHNISYSTPGRPWSSKAPKVTVGLSGSSASTRNVAVVERQRHDGATLTLEREGVVRRRHDQATVRPGVHTGETRQVAGSPAGRIELQGRHLDPEVGLHQLRKQ